MQLIMSAIVTQCVHVVPENIHTRSTEGISRKYPLPSTPEFPFYEHKNNPLTRPEFPEILCIHHIPSGKNNFGKEV